MAAADTNSRAARTVTILYTGDTRGWVEPCGCSQGVLGGLPRRATLLKRLRAQTPKALIVDAGALLGESSDELKAPVIVEQLAAMRYCAANLGPADARWRNQLLALMRKNNLPGISLEYADGAAIRRGRILVVNGVRVGLAGVARLPTGSDRRELRDVLAYLRRSCDLVVLLSAASANDNVRLARQFAGMDVLIGVVPGKKPQLLRCGKVLLAPVTPEGGHVGRLVVRLGRRGIAGATLEARPKGRLDGRTGAQPRLNRRSQQPKVHFSAALLDLHPLNDRIPDDTPTLQAVQAYYDRVAKRLLAGEDARPTVMVKAGYTLASSCDFCHPRIYRKWKSVAHSRAVETLKKKGRDRAPDCLQCHSEYYRRTKQAPVEAYQRAGVECASCHGEGFVLILRPSKKLDAAKPGEKVCRGCHTPQRSPKFNFAKYKAMIKHW
jgi:hypothetical protein